MHFVQCTKVSTAQRTETSWQINTLLFRGSFGQLFTYLTDCHTIDSNYEDTQVILFIEIHYYNYCLRLGGFHWMRVLN